LHAADLARALGIPRVIVPRFPGALSALGLLLADARKDYSRSLIMPAKTSHHRIREVLDELHRTGKREMMAEGFAVKAMHHTDAVDMRYRGQSYELSIPMDRGFVEEFHKAHERRYGYSTPDKPVEIVNVRTSFFGGSEKPQFRAAPKVRGAAKPIEVTMVWMNGRRLKTPIYDRDSLRHGHLVHGPAIIGEYSSTTLVPPDFVCRVDAHLNLVMGSGS